MIPYRFRILETEHWLLNHRMDCALPGYLMLGSANPADDLSDLPNEALISLGPLLERAQRLMQSKLRPARIYTGRFGHTAGYPIHFHLIPIYTWVETLFWSDPRYRALEAFGENGKANETDGAELTLYVWREFCESRKPPPVEGPAVEEVVTILRSALSGSLSE